MVKEITGDLIQEFKEGRVNVIVHQANCFHTMRSGVAGAIVRNFPEAEAADNKTVRGSKDKLSCFSAAKIHDVGIILNLYSQYDIVGEPNTSQEDKSSLEKLMTKAHRATRYDAIMGGFERIRDSIESNQNRTGEKYILGIPYGYGSALGGGRWPIVRAMIDAVFADSNIEVVIVRLPNIPDLT